MVSDTRILHIHDPHRLENGSSITWRVAFASDDLSTVNQHFGLSSGFNIHSLSEYGHQLITVVRMGEEDMLAHAQRLHKRMALLQGCDLLYCVAIGEAARQQLWEIGIVALTVPSGTAIVPLLGRLPSPLFLPHARRQQALPKEQKEDHFAAILGGQWEEEPQSLSHHNPQLSNPFAKGDLP
ncbi:NifB/NifX family molybdenum-iron cluster-binding protein [Candidatus Magnetaquicoccus inordinatus]|uniref:NifB/NifX family molybdenum-iron cluster-binding protein n=1 Tax=Candidatus Magnetaquicoccus inordinatus TaxID=2496818 RepID=UPI00102C91EC|nr:NifB/NifX family molybdenum-iron cluster-binding protein [Candidatus Magnetaquicoccus inordinatus]